MIVFITRGVQANFRARSFAGLGAFALVCCASPQEYMYQSLANMNRLLLLQLCRPEHNDCKHHCRQRQARANANMQGHNMRNNGNVLNRYEHPSFLWQFDTVLVLSHGRLRTQI